MDIIVVKGTGTGPTKLAAFDAALRDAGIANLNILTLSSVIPPSAKIKVVDSSSTPPGTWGDRLYVVLAEKRVDTPGEDAWAGVGWTQDETGKGLFVEHEGSSKQKVEQDISSTLKSMTKARPDVFGEIQSHVVGLTCTAQPVCALVCAVYKSEPW